MRRREFLGVLGGAATLAARGARAAVGDAGDRIPRSASPDSVRDPSTRVPRGLNETGYVEGQNVDIEYRWAEAQNDRLPMLAAQLVHRQVTVIVAAGGTASALAAKAATASVPIVFGIAADPVGVGLVASLNRPGGNVTGVTSLNVEVGPKRLELLRELLPSATIMALLVNPTSPALAEPVARDLQAAAPPSGCSSMFCMRAASAISIRSLQAWSNDEQARSSSAPTTSSLPGANDSLH